MDPDEIEPSGVAETSTEPPPQEKICAPDSGSTEEEQIVETEDKDVGAEEETSNKPADTIRRTSRLFIRNLPYSVKEDDIRGHMEQFGAVEEVCCRVFPRYLSLCTQPAT